MPSFGGPADGSAGVLAPMFQALADVTVANTTAETSVFSPTCIGSLVLPANRAQVGTKLGIYIGLLYTLPTLNAADLTVRLKLGGQTLTSLSIPALLFGGVAQAGVGAVVNAALTFRTVGPVAQVVPSGGCLFDTAATGNARYKSLIIPSTPTVDSTQPLTVDATAQWGSSLAQASNALQIRIAELTMVN